MDKTGSSLSRVRIIYVATTIFIMVLSVYSYIQIKNLVDSSDRVNHTNQVNLSLEKISIAIIDAETNQKSFLLIGDSSCLLKRDSAFISLSLELNAIDSLTRDNPEQVANLKVLNATINEKLESMEKVMHAHSPLPMSTEFKSNIVEGIEKTRNIKQVIDKMVSNETSLLQQREQKFSHLAFITPFFVIILFFGAMLILLASYLRINRAYHQASNLQKLAIDKTNKLNETLTSKKLLEESEQRFRNLIYTSPSAIGILYGEDLKITIANKPIIEIWGKGEDILGKAYFEALPELAEQGYKEVFAQVYKTGVPHNAIETPVHILQNGVKTLKYYNFILYPMRNISNEVDGIGIIATEVTSQALLNNKIKESEQQHRELAILLEEKVKERTTELSEKNIQLQKTNKELESFAYISSHDLQEPLRKIQTFSTRILEKEIDNLSEHGKDNFKRMQESAKRMQTLINDLLVYSRTNTADRIYETTDLNKIIDEVKEDMKEELKEKHATIEANELCEADIIPFQFRQLMHNLIGNSLKFSNPETPPHIKIKSKIEEGIKLNNRNLLPQKKYCHINVTDNGIGFEQQYSEKIFEVFQRLHGKSEYNGTGIGLSIVKKIVENHAGIITATGELKKGASFDIYLPAT